MSEQQQQPFRSRDEELEHLGQQLGDIREALREIGGRVSQIERHVKRAFGVSELPGQLRQKEARRSEESASGQPTFSPEEAMAAFDGLVRTWKDGEPGRVDAKLQNMSIADLKLMAHEVGLSFASKPSRKAFASAIIGRINESVMLSRNTNLTPSRAEQMRENDGKKSPEAPEDVR